MLCLCQALCSCCLQGVVEVVKKGSVKNIAVSMEDRQGGRKHITRLVHVESFALNPGAGALLLCSFQLAATCASQEMTLHCGLLPDDSLATHSLLYSLTPCVSLMRP